MAAERRKCLRILGLQEGASEEEIRKAYKKLALQYHPDKNESDDAKSKFQEIGYAYKYLTEGPSACGTADPHDIREEMLRRMFEEMFFARFRSPYGGFPFFCEESDDDDYYVYSGSSDNNCYCGSCNTKGSNRRTYQSTWTPPAAPSYQNLSKKQLRKREKKQRQRERAREHKRQDRRAGGQSERQPNNNPRTDNVNAESKKEAPERPIAKDNPEEKNDTGSSRPDTPVLKQQPQKMNKKQRKKIESEQRKREKEMEEIAVELRKKQEQEMEKRKEKERVAAQKREEEKENEINYSYLFENGKKSRKARQREKKRQVSGNNNQQDLQRDDSCGSLQSGKPFHNLDTNTDSFPTGKMKEKSGPSIDKNTGSKSDAKKYGLNGNRYNVLDDIDDLFGPQSGSSVSSSGSLKNSQVPEEKSRETSGVAQNSGYTFQDTDRWNKTSGPAHGSSFAGGSYTPDGNRQFRSRTYQNSNRYQESANRNNNFGYVQTDDSVRTKKKTSFVPGEAIGKGNKMKDEEKSTSGSKGNNGLSDNSKETTDELEDGSEREFVKDWSATQIDEDDNLDDLDLGYGAKRNGHYGNGSGQISQNSNRVDKGNFGYGYNNSYQPYHQRGFPSQRRREFIPKTRGYHGPEFRPFYGWPPSFPAGMAGPPPFPRQRFQPPYHPHFRGNFVTRPAPRFRGGGYPGQRYGQPMEKTDYRHGNPGRPLPPDFPPNKNKGNIPHDHKKNMEGDSKSNKGSYVKSYENDLNCEQDVREETDSNERVTSPEISKTRKNEPSASSHFDKNMFSAFEDNQAGSRDSFDSLDDFISFETGPRTNGSAPTSRPFSTETVDMGLDEFLSKDNLGVPKGMFSENIKNYYK